MNFKTSREQCEFYFGSGVALDKYKEELEKLPPASMEMLQQISPYLHKKHEWATQKHLMQQLNDFMEANDVFGLALLLIMLRYVDNEECKMLREFTNKMLLKRLRSLTDGSPESMVQDFWTNLDNYIRLMAKLMQEVS